MTRTTTLSTLWCTALVATLAAYGCGSSSTIDTGTGGKTAGTGGKTGTGGGAVIIGTGGMSGGGTGGMVGVDAGGPPADAGVNMCAPTTACTAGFTCTRNCNAGGGRGAGTQACTCNNNNRVACGNCVPNDAGVVPPPVDAAPVDAGPRVDAGPICMAMGGQPAPQNNRPCTLGTPDCTRNVGGGGTQLCTCVGVPDAGADAAVAARWMCQ